MRLIDADALMKEFAEFVKESNNSDFADVPTWNDAVSLLGSAPTVEAIPKEWIEDWQNKHEWEYESFFRMVNGVPKYAVECMLEDWEEEHDNQERPL